MAACREDVEDKFRPRICRFPRRRKWKWACQRHPPKLRLERLRSRSTEGGIPSKAAPCVSRGEAYETLRSGESALQSGLLGGEQLFDSGFAQSQQALQFTLA